jgi:hypothetical protein
MRGRPSPIGCLLIMVFGSIMLGSWVCDNRKRGGPPARPSPSAPGPSQGSRADPPGATAEQIRRQLAPPPNIERRDGTAVAVLVDTSGSMREKVPDADGRNHPKIDIAQERLLDMVSRCEEFVREHPDRPLQLGIYEFSARKGMASSRQVLPVGAPDISAAQAAVQKMRPNGNTPIGDAMIMAKQDLNKTGFSRTHILVLTDGENNRGVAPQRVAEAIAGLPEDSRSSVYFIAFDVAASRFQAVRDAGALVLPASSGTELAQALDYILTGKILAEQPELPPAGESGGQ